MFQQCHNTGEISPKEVMNSIKTSYSSEKLMSLVLDLRLTWVYGKYIRLIALKTLKIFKFH